MTHERHTQRHLFNLPVILCPEKHKDINKVKENKKGKLIRHTYIVKRSLIEISSYRCCSKYACTVQVLSPEMETVKHMLPRKIGN
jgi:hypothetical protein